jgi:hypothetical protein
VDGTDCTGSCKSNYHTITTTTVISKWKDTMGRCFICFLVIMKKEYCQVFDVELCILYWLILISYGEESDLKKIISSGDKYMLCLLVY